MQHLKIKPLNNLDLQNDIQSHGVFVLVLTYIYMRTCCKLLRGTEFLLEEGVPAYFPEALKKYFANFRDQFFGLGLKFGRQWIFILKVEIFHHVLGAPKVFHPCVSSCPHLVPSGITIGVIPMPKYKGAVLAGSQQLQW